MRTRLLTALALAVGSVFCTQAQASGDDSCYPNWTILKERLDVCSNLAFLSPGNDSQVNLRLLLADQGALALQPHALNNEDLAQGYGPVPFPLYRLGAAVPRPESETDEPTAPQANASLSPLLEKLGIQHEVGETAGDAFLQGEGSRCRSNGQASATAFIEQLVASPELSDTERRSLANARLQLLSVCGWDASQQAGMLPGDLKSSTGKAFATYLQAASDFYSGRFAEATKGFAALADSTQPWLKQTALYMSARTALNDAQQNAFNEYGERSTEQLDKARLQQAESGFEQYLQAYPQGEYAASAQGLLRRVHWLANDADKLARDFARQLTQTSDAQRNVSLDELVSEVDTKLLTVNRQAVQTPLLMAVNDLMWMREKSTPQLTEADLQAQKAIFAEQPALYEYVQAAFAFYAQNDPAKALTLLPDKPPATLDYLSFSQQMLRGLALQARQDWKAAQSLWEHLLPLATQPLQREQLELALAMSYERDEQLARVFAADSPIKSQQVRYTLLRHVADADLLRQQITQGPDATERNTALFVLLYKDLLRSRYADFAEDFKRLPTTLPDEKLGYSLGYVYEKGPELALFHWQGDKAQSGYTCPSIAQTAATLQADNKSPQGLNCLGEFMLRNQLDSMPLDQKRHADSLGGTAPGFAGEVFSRLEGYKQVIANSKAPRDDKAYALFRAINCYAPSGYNSCNGKDVAPAVRKAWFKQLKGEFADTRWSKSLQYYW
ncbi:tol-pal system YbgF family protein [Pseudomonas capsici]|uniref:outer membrane assembly lipoprotein YfiO n=1 Tax=Pseudomonas capsici TaxID=2810614 RepID=UPI0021F10E75|nr:outer membrane assembly lipoprotein YfiO [Pseudomonas capsici]MCV4344067.1 outer membrane assembly lipoprotein YfiO [Pseudomonas capsici]